MGDTKMTNKILTLYTLIQLASLPQYGLASEIIEPTLVFSDITLASKSSQVKNIASDTAITAEIKRKFFADPDISAFDVHVETINGTVTLSGTVPEYALKQKAISLTKEVDGVTEVVSHISIDQSSATNKIISDSVITGAIKTKLLNEKDLSGIHIHVETNNGTVKLTGTVPNKAANNKAIALAQDTDGVKKVISELTIKK